MPWNVQYVDINLPEDVHLKLFKILDSALLKYLTSPYKNAIMLRWFHHEGINVQFVETASSIHTRIGNLYQFRLIMYPFIIHFTTIM